MKTTPKSLLRLAMIFLCTSSLSSVVQAQTLIIGNPVMSGNGCAPGTTSVVLSPDQSVLSVLFSAFSAEAGPEVGRANARTICEMRIPVKVPDGYKLKVMKIDYRGFVSLPTRISNARLTTRHGFLDRKRNKRAIAGDNKQYLGPASKDIIETQSLRNAWDSDCGAQTDIELQTELEVSNRGTNDRAGTAFLSLESMDAPGAGLFYDMELKPCNGNGRNR